MNDDHSRSSFAGECSIISDRRFYGVSADWPLSSETPPLHTARPLPSGQFCSSAVNNRLRATENRFPSDRPVFPLETAPRAPTPRCGTSGAVSGEFTSGDKLNGPCRFRGPQLTPGEGLHDQALGASTHTCLVNGNIRDRSVIMMASGIGAGTCDGPAVPILAHINPGQYFKDALARDATNVTPGVDDTPYILYALNALTGSIARSAGELVDGSDHDNGNIIYRRSSDRHVQEDGLGHCKLRSFPRDDVNIGTASIDMPVAPSPVQLGIERRCSTEIISTCEPRKGQQSSPPMPGSPRPGEPRVSTASSFSTLIYPGTQTRRISLPSRHLKDAWTYLDLKNISPQAQLVFPPSDFKPAIMRPLSLVLLAILCVCLAVALIVCAVFSKSHHGLVEYSGSIYGGQFFLFRILPQLPGVVVLLYAQSLSLAITRIHPFSRMQALGHPHPKERSGAIFDNLYPRSFLLPHTSSAMPWNIRLSLLALWLANFIVPVQSSLFSVALAGDRWCWAIVQGSAWTLVGMYICLTITVVFVLVDWHGRSTGLIWDPRSIADMITLASNSNTMADYKGSELLATRNDIRAALQHRTIDKLGYWTWKDGRASGLWHGIGTDHLDDAWFGRQNSDGQSNRAKEILRLRNKKSTVSTSGMLVGVDPETLALSPHSKNVRYRYLPWCIRDGPLVFFIIASFLLLLSIFIMSFLPAASVKKGFLPLVPANPSAGAFSAANFLYSFLPAMLGQIFFLLFLSLDMTLRILQPWAELSRNAGGSQPETSILADYSVCLPLQSTWHALRNQHWRVASFSLMSTCSAFLPALSGGLFMALTTSTGEVRMVPNMILYAFVLAMLVTCFACIVSVLPGRKNFRLPHAVTCVAEILSFCASDDLLQEPAFRNAYNKTTLLSQLGVNSLPACRSRWIFATGTSSDDCRLSIRRVRRYTELTNRPSGRRP